jgi:hypothetical protein
VEFKRSHERGSSFSTDMLLRQELRGMVKSCFLLGRGTNFHLIYSFILSCIPDSKSRNFLSCSRGMTQRLSFSFYIPSSADAGPRVSRRRQRGLSFVSTIADSDTPRRHRRGPRTSHGPFFFLLMCLPLTPSMPTGSTQSFCGSCICRNGSCCKLTPSTPTGSFFSRFPSTCPLR